MIKGDIGLFELPRQGGHEQEGMRPAIIVSYQNNCNHNMLMVIPITSNLTATRYPNTIELIPSTENGLTKPSIALIFQLRSISKNRFKKHLGKLSLQDLNYINLNMKALLQI
ncbi:type II toxin-antitoxin system PemK/MazF family toxin [Leptospira harrisiae]|uniref:type II toxin-antitoxin system PemK/MazF family toxin n=1 Tax=Leptospira harrisiae TaxID=2023189 RepID=UPI000C2B1AFC|nr:type II toxin-antitoxin system PemK/MazF family toxin [Leptospira harrisiae]PKA09995.1 hypothetical protein CH366_10065 [Leptospira harrisiae]